MRLLNTYWRRNLDAIIAGYEAQHRGGAIQVGTYNLCSNSVFPDRACIQQQFKQIPGDALAVKTFEAV